MAKVIIEGTASQIISASQSDCGCHWGAGRISWCPVHEAAVDLLRAVKDARLMLYAWRGGRRSDGLSTHQELNESIEICETAIRKAEPTQ